MPSTIGQQLKRARLERNLSFEEIFESTHIRVKYLKALEADDFSVMPSPVQGRGFLRLYAQYLDLDVDALLEELRKAPKGAPEDESTFHKVEPVSLPEKPEEDAEETTQQDDEEAEEESLWDQFQRRVSEALASSEADTAQEAESDPITEANQNQARPEASLDVGEDEQIEPSQPPEESQIIFAKIGETLRERREMLSLTYDEIEGHIHLRPHYLAALEAGDFDALPSPVQMRGMLSNYAEFLDLDADALLLRFAEGLQTKRLERHLEEQEKFEKSRKKRKGLQIGGFVAPDLIFGIGMATLLIAFTIWGLGRIAESNVNPAVEATAPSIAEVLMSTPTVAVEDTPTPTVVVNTPDPNAATEIPLEELGPEDVPGVEILLTVLERSWLRVYVDGELEFEGRANPDATFVYEGNESVEVLTANGAGVRIAYNQRDLGLMGGFGEVVQRIYGARGILTPTVTPTLDVTPTFTPTLTATPTQTPTLAPAEGIQ